VGNLRVGDVLIDDGRIAEVGQDLRARGAEVIDAVDTIVMPGFVDAHRHVADSLFRATGDRSPAPRATLGPEDTYAATLIGLLGAAEAGITTVVDWADATDQGVIDAALQAHADSGLRTVYATGATDSRTRGQGAALTEWASAPREVSEWADARRAGLRIHAHAGKGTESGRPDVVVPVLDSDVTLVHCSGFANRDLDSVASSGASIVLTPCSEMAGGVEPVPMQKLVDRGIRPGLGVDTETMAPGDLFAQMRAVISLQHATLFDLKLAGKAGIPKLLTTREVIRYATADGARAVGMGETIGSLTPGKRADVLVLRADRPNIYPINDPVGAVVWGMDTSNVDWVLVDGVPVKREGELTTDVARAGEMARAAQARVLASKAAMAVAEGKA
jgi:cytosine/adenosine deaminase-related metal-dependent hydrolase